MDSCSFRAMLNPLLFLVGGTLGYVGDPTFPNFQERFFIFHYFWKELEEISSFVKIKKFLSHCLFTYIVFFLSLRLTQKALQLFFFFPSRHFFWMYCQKLFSQRFIISHQESVWPRLTHSLDTPKSLSVKIVLQVVVFRDACGTWHGLCTLTSIHSIQKSTRKSQKRGNKLVRPVNQWMLAEDSIVKTEKLSR